MYPLPRRLLVVLFAFMFLSISLVACGGSGEPPPATIRRVVLDCPDCEAAGQPANIWADRSLSAVACRLEWGNAVNLVDVSADGSVGRIRSGDCDGWVRSSLYRNVRMATPTPAGRPHTLAPTDLLAEPVEGAEVVGVVAPSKVLYLVAQTADGRWLQVNTGGWLRTVDVVNPPQGLRVAGLTPDP